MTYNQHDIADLVLEAADLMVFRPTTPMGEALTKTIMDQSQKAHANLTGCLETVMAGENIEDEDIQQAVKRGILSLTVAHLLLLENLPEGPDA